MLDATTHQALLIRSARVIDPACGRDEMADLAVVDGRLAERAPADACVLEADGLLVCPGLIDIHVHLREPGFEHKETIASGTASAAAGGFTRVACMPNTKPTLDTPDLVQLVQQRAQAAERCTVYPVAALTRGRAGCETTDFKALLAAGAVAFSDDGTGVQDDDVMRAAFAEAARIGAVLIQHCEDDALAAGGVMHLGAVSARLGYPGMDPRAEEAMLERDLDLCRATGAQYHVAHVSTADAVELVRRAKAEGLPVTSEVCTHHLLLTDEACAEGDPNTKVHPPLRPQADVDACRRGLLDGTIDCIVTDHAPHTAEEKGVGFLQAPPGFVGFETALGVAAEALVHSGMADWPALIKWFTLGPATALDLPVPALRLGAPAELTLIDPQASWTVEQKCFLSRSQNSPFLGRTLTGRAIATVRGLHLLSLSLTQRRVR